MPRIATKALALSRRFSRSERGGTMVLSLFMLATCVMVAGLAVDPSKVWDEKEELHLAADAAAQAGIVAVANRKTEAEARQAVLAAIQSNAPVEEVGETIADPVTDIRMVRYDPYTKTIAAGTPANAVAVTLHRDESVGNPIRTVFLGLAGVSGFETSVTSVAYYGAPGRCSSSDGIYAVGQVTFSSQNYIGPRYCVHSQTQVWLPQQNTFAPTSGVSMPHLSMCKGKCVNSANPGIEEAVFQMNLQLPSVSLHISSVVSAMKSSTANPLKTRVFANKPLDSDLSALKAQGINTAQLKTGSVVSLSNKKFDALTRIPTGLVYDVACTANGNGTNTSIAIGGGTNGDILRNVALITNCSLTVNATAAIDNAVIVTTRVASASVLDAAEGASVGDPLKNCDLSKKVYILANSGISVNSNFTASNVAFVVNGDINVAASSGSSTVTHNGTSMQAQGQIKIASSHTFNPCSEDTSGLIPNLNTIKLVLPKNLTD